MTMSTSDTSSNSLSDSGQEMSKTDIVPFFCAPYWKTLERDPLPLCFTVSNLDKPEWTRFRVIAAATTVRIAQSVVKGEGHFIIFSLPPDTESLTLRFTLFENPCERTISIVEDMLPPPTMDRCKRNLLKTSKILTNCWKSHAKEALQKSLNIGLEYQIDFRDHGQRRQKHGLDRSGDQRYHFCGREPESTLHDLLEAHQPR